MLIDTHAHLYSRQFKHDRDEMLQRAFKNGVTRLYLPNIDIDSIDPMLELERKYPENCFAMMGLHPCSVDKNVELSLKIVREYLWERPFCAVGEIGLDYYHSLEFVEAQKHAFIEQSRWAKELDLPVVIHARESTADLISIVKREKTENFRGVFHCFSGTSAEAKEVIDLGFYIGIGGVVTYKKTDLERIVAETPLECIVLETDAPYLTPNPHRGKRNESSYIPIIAQKIADIKRIPFEKVAEQTTHNALQLFKEYQLA